jgi:hypothetical protein
VGDGLVGRGGKAAVEASLGEEELKEEEEKVGLAQLSSSAYTTC